jgi:type I restriction enzyme S subunit
MQDLLTRGIDEAGNVRSEETHAFKDSALGRIPVEWEVERLGKICERIQDGTHFSPQPTRLGEFLYLTSKNIRMGRLNLKNVLYITKKEHDAIYKRCSVEEGDVLLTKDGANTGNVALNTLKVPFSLLSSVAFLRGKEDVLNNRYLNFCLVSPDMQSRLKGQMSGNAIPRITLTKINSTSIRLPLHPEQEIIETRFAAFEKEYKLELANLSKLNHLKTALMQDLLTGNKRVDDLLD